MSGVQLVRASSVSWVVLGLLGGCWQDEPASSESNSPAAAPAGVMLEAESCTSAATALPSGWSETLVASGMTKCVMPFGIIIAADAAVPDSYINQAARIVAEVVDPDRDGVANDPAVLNYMANGAHVWLPMPADEDDWSRGTEQALEEALGSYGIMIPEWWMGDFTEDGPDEHALAVMVEEIIHAFTQFGYGLAYPTVFGVDDWTSVIAQETQAAQCEWWQHPENSCPGSPSEGGDCSSPSCDVSEFYQQVVVMRAGMTPGWLGIGFPDGAASLELKLSDEIKAAIDNPDHNQLRQPLSFKYPN